MEYHFPTDTPSVCPLSQHWLRADNSQVTEGGRVWQSLGGGRDKDHPLPQDSGCC